MKVLWLCNIVPPLISKKLGMESTNKEGWISGLMESVLNHKSENKIELCIAAPMKKLSMANGQYYVMDALNSPYGAIPYYLFYENTDHAENYDPYLETALQGILDSCSPDIVHCFGTEYPHTLAVAKAISDKNRLLISLQGICSAIADTYYASLPDKIIHSSTFRDFIKKDNILRQQKKFSMRGMHEKEALKLAANVSGRTEFDHFYASSLNKNVHYYHLNETLRPEFYEGAWSFTSCIPHSIFMSQGDYPLKGLHYMLKAFPQILEKFPDAQLFIAGNSLVKYKTILQKIKISGYGNYLRQLLHGKDFNISDKIKFLGKQNASEMKSCYLKSHTFVCCSSMENSPNSLGEAMLLGVPCISADVGGIPSMFTGGVDGILYKGFRSSSIGFYCHNNDIFSGAISYDEIVSNLTESIIEMWSDNGKLKEYSKNARQHALANHSKEDNYNRLMDIYKQIYS